MENVKPNIWVTGGNGQLAKCLQEEAKNLPVKEILFTDKREVDITSMSSIEKILKNKKIQYCINTAAYTAVDNAENDSDKAFLVNTKGVKNLAQACKEFGVCLIHISTDFVFDGGKRKSYHENDKTNPINIYGASKLKGEIYIQQLLKEYFIIRTSWLYSRYGSNFVKTMLRLGKEKNEINVVSNQYGSPTYALDLAKFLIFLAKGNFKNFGVYHFSNEGEISWYQFAKEIFNIAGLSCKVNPIKSSEYKTLAKRPAYSRLSLDKLKSEFSYPINAWEESLKDCLRKINI